MYGIFIFPGKLSSMGYGFVQYKTPEAAQKAIRQLQVSLVLMSSFLFHNQVICKKKFSLSAALHCRWSSAGNQNFRKRSQVR